MTVLWANNWYANDVGGNAAHICKEMDWRIEIGQGKEQKRLEKQFEETLVELFLGARICLVEEREETSVIFILGASLVYQLS